MVLFLRRPCGGKKIVKTSAAGQRILQGVKRKKNTRELSKSFAEEGRVAIMTRERSSKKKAVEN